jgi:APA family basic amino acid/polyamine antiporter
MLILVVITTILVVGIRESATTNALLVLVKLLVIILALAVGWSWVQPANWMQIPIDRAPGSEGASSKWGLIGFLGGQSWLAPLDDWARCPFAPYGFSGIMVGASIVFFSYIGFDSISTHAEEAIKPQRDLPIGILASLVLCTVLYIAVSALITGMVPYPEINPRAAVAAAFTDLASREQGPLLRWVAILISAGALAGITSVLLVTFLSQARIFLAMARDRLLPHALFGTVHPRFHTPHRATLLTGALVAVAAGFTPMSQLQNMVNIGTLLAFIIVALAVLILRVRQPNTHRPFRCPAVWCIAPLAILVNLVMMLFLPPETWLRLVVWLAIGFVLYFCRGRFQSALYRMNTAGGSTKPLSRAWP